MRTTTITMSGCSSMVTDVYIYCILMLLTQPVNKMGEVFIYLFIYLFINYHTGQL